MGHNFRYVVKDCLENMLIMTLANFMSLLLSKYNNQPADFILYTQTGQDCLNIASFLSLGCDDISITICHGGLTTEQKQSAYKNWLLSKNSKHTVIVATSAFGCGLNVPTVRAVVHIRRPRTIVDYLQESGRAGCDGSPADCIVLNIFCSTIM